MKPTDDELEAMAVRLEAEVNIGSGTVTPLRVQAAAMLRACKGRVRVKPLEWYGKPEGQDQRIGRCGDIAYSVRFDMGSWGYTRSGKSGLTVGYKGGPLFKDEADAINGADVDHEFRILAAIIEPAPDHAEWDAAIEAAAKVVRDCIYRDSAGTGFDEDQFESAIRQLKKGQTND